jgi:hypothetical protein
MVALPVGKVFPLAVAIQVLPEIIAEISINYFQSINP